MTIKTALFSGTAVLAFTLGACATDKTSSAAPAAASTTATASESTTTTTSAAPATEAAMPPPAETTSTTTTSMTTAPVGTSTAPPVDTGAATTTSTTTTETTTETLKPVTKADIKVGAAVYDSTGATLGKVTAVTAAGATVKVGTTSGTLPFASLGMNSKGLAVAVTKAEFLAAAKPKK